VTLDAYWIDRTEVTNAQFAAFLNQVGNQIEGGVAWLEDEGEKSLIEEVDGEYWPEAGCADHPVTKVSWYGAVAYCDPVGGELPSEAMWDGPEGYTYSWGEDPPTCGLANAAGCEGSTKPVGSLPEGASWSGAQDMAGNVWDWVYNWYTPYPGSQYENEDFGRIFKVVRGGSWKFEPYYLRAAQRNLEYMPDVRGDQIGFRCVASADPLVDHHLVSVLDGFNLPGQFQRDVDALFLQAQHRIHRAYRIDVQVREERGLRHEPLLVHLQLAGQDASKFIKRKSAISSCH
jgi:formylglycine-generating enzyme required for sulfatase activity